MSSAVLILDDDAEFRSFISAVLEARGYQCAHAGTQAEAWNHLKTRNFDLLVVDGVLPDGSGVDFIAALRASGSAVPILFASAYRWDDATLQRLSGPLGVVEVIAKPLTAPELLLRAGATLELARKRASPDPEESGGQKDAEQRLRLLREGFTARVPQRLSELEQAVRDISNGGTQAIEQAAALAHRLRGAAGTFGHQRLSSSAARLEGLLRAAQEQPRRIGPDWWSEVGLALSRARVGLSDEQDVPSFLPDLPSRVLVVGEDNAALEEAARFAKARRLDVMRANNAAQALQRAQDEEAPDGALVEVEMSGTGGGFAVLEALRAVPGLERLPVAFFSADGGLQNRLAAARLGAELYLPKPLSALDLGYAVRGLLDRRAPEPTRALFLCPNPSTSGPWAEALSAAGVALHRVDEPQNLLDALSEVNPEVLLLDLVTPRVSALDLCRAVRANPRWQLLPILTVNGPEDMEVQIGLLEAGADDYLPKGAPDELLLARVRGRVERYRLSSRMLARDPLTGLYPRPVFREYAQRLLSEARRRAEGVTIAILAVDRQEERVRAHGAALADHHRAAFGRLIHAQLRRHDLRGYWGDERFALAFMNERPIGARIAVARVTDDLRRRRFTDPQGREIRLTASAGIVSFPTAGTTVDELVQAAELLLERAQVAGGDRIEL